MPGSLRDSTAIFIQDSRHFNPPPQSFGLLWKHEALAKIQKAPLLRTLWVHKRGVITLLVQEDPLVPKGLGVVACNSSSTILFPPFLKGNLIVSGRLVLISNFFISLIEFHECLSIIIIGHRNVKNIYFLSKVGLTGFNAKFVLRDSELTKIPFYISSSGHLCRPFNHKILSVALLRLRFCSIRGNKSDLKLSAKLGILVNSESLIRRRGKSWVFFLPFWFRRTHWGLKGRGW